jgi:protein-disulfide isomerase
LKKSKVEQKEEGKDEESAEKADEEEDEEEEDMWEVPEPGPSNDEGWGLSLNQDKEALKQKAIEDAKKEEQGALNPNLDKLLHYHYD